MKTNALKILLLLLLFLSVRSSLFAQDRYVVSAQLHVSITHDLLFDAYVNGVRIIDSQDHLNEVVMDIPQDLSKDERCALSKENCIEICVHQVMDKSGKTNSMMGMAYVLQLNLSDNSSIYFTSEDGHTAQYHRQGFEPKGWLNWGYDDHSWSKAETYIPTSMATVLMNPVTKTRTTYFKTFDDGSDGHMRQTAGERIFFRREFAMDISPAPECLAPVTPPPNPLPPTIVPIASTATFTFTPSSTLTSVPPTATFTFTSTSTPPPAATATPIPPTVVPTFTFTPPPTSTPVPQATATSIPPTATFTRPVLLTSTPLPPTATFTHPVFTFSPVPIVLTPTPKPIATTGSKPFNMAGAMISAPSLGVPRAAASANPSYAAPANGLNLPAVPGSYSPPQPTWTPRPLAARIYPTSVPTPLYRPIPTATLVPLPRMAYNGVSSLPAPNMVLPPVSSYYRPLPTSTPRPYLAPASPKAVYGSEVYAQPTFVNSYGKTGTNNYANVFAQPTYIASKPTAWVKPIVYAKPYTATPLPIPTQTFTPVPVRKKKAAAVKTARRWTVTPTSTAVPAVPAGAGAVLAFSNLPININASFGDGPGTYQCEIVDRSGNHVNTVYQKRVAFEKEDWISWDATNDKGQLMPSGYYFAVFTKDGRLIRRILINWNRPTQ